MFIRNIANWKSSYCSVSREVLAFVDLNYCSMSTPPHPWNIATWKSLIFASGWYKGLDFLDLSDRLRQGVWPAPVFLRALPLGAPPPGPHHGRSHHPLRLIKEGCYVEKEKIHKIRSLHIMMMSINCSKGLNQFVINTWLENLNVWKKNQILWKNGVLLNF